MRRILFTLLVLALPCPLWADGDTFYHTNENYNQYSPWAGGDGTGFWSGPQWHPTARFSTNVGHIPAVGSGGAVGAFMQWTVPTTSGKKYKVYITWPGSVETGNAAIKSSNTVVNIYGHNGSNYQLMDSGNVDQTGEPGGPTKTALGVTNIARQFQYVGEYIAIGAYAVVRVVPPGTTNHYAYVDGLCMEEITPLMGFPGVLDGQYDVPYPANASGIKPAEWPTVITVQFQPCGEMSFGNGIHTAVVQGCADGDCTATESELAAGLNCETPLQLTWSESAPPVVYPSPGAPMDEWLDTPEYPGGYVSADQKIVVRLVRSNPEAFGYDPNPPGANYWWVLFDTTTHVMGAPETPQWFWSWNIAGPSGDALSGYNNSTFNPICGGHWANVDGGHGGPGMIIGIPNGQGTLMPGCSMYIPDEDGGGESENCCCAPYDYTLDHTSPDDPFVDHHSPSTSPRTDWVAKRNYMNSAFQQLKDMFNIPGDITEEGEVSLNLTLPYPGSAGIPVQIYSKPLSNGDAPMFEALDTARVTIRMFFTAVMVWCFAWYVARVLRQY